MIARLDHVAVAVRDLQKSIDFYASHFAMEHYFTQENVRPPQLLSIAYLRSAQGVVELMHRPTHETIQGFHFCFVTDDFDADFKRLVGEGVPVKSEPHPTAARIPAEANWMRCVFEGPDGEEVELRGPGAR